MSTGQRRLTRGAQLSLGRMSKCTIVGCLSDRKPNGSITVGSKTRSSWRCAIVAERPHLGFMVQVAWSSLCRQGKSNRFGSVAASFIGCCSLRATRSQYLSRSL